MGARISIHMARLLGLERFGVDVKQKPRPRRKRTPRPKPQPLVGPAQSWTIIVPDYLPPTVNSLLKVHWSKRKKIKEECAALVKHYGRHVLPATSKRRVLITLTMTTLRAVRDEDNVKKIVHDALVKVGFLVDDSPAWVEGPPPIQVKGERKALTIFVEEIDP